MYEIKSKTFLGSMYKQFKVEDFIFSISLSANTFPGYTLLRIVAAKGHSQTYFAIYDKNKDEFIWDYSIKLLESGESYNKDNILSSVVIDCNTVKVLIKEFEGYYVLFGDEKTKVRKNIKTVFDNNKEEILETIDVIEFEKLLD